MKICANYNIYFTGRISEGVYSEKVFLNEITILKEGQVLEQVFGETNFFKDSEGTEWLINKDIVDEHFTKI